MELAIRSRRIGILPSPASGRQCVSSAPRVDMARVRLITRTSVVTLFLLGLLFSLGVRLNVAGLGQDVTLLLTLHAIRHVCPSHGDGPLLIRNLPDGGQEIRCVEPERM